MKPTATWCLFTYRQSAWAAEALSSALAQEVDALEVRVYDDGSDDGTHEVLRAVMAGYRGPHRVVLSEERAHVGLAAQLNRAAREASGDLVIVAAGDDVARPNRARRLLEAFRPGVSALHSNATVIDEAGVERGPWMSNLSDAPKDGNDVLEGRWQIFGATAAYERSLLLAQGGLLDGVVAEDLALSLRAVRAGRVVVIDEPLVLYRRHDRNVSLGSDGLDDPAQYRRHLAHRVRFLEGANRQWAHDLRATAQGEDDRVRAATCERRAGLAALAGRATERRLTWRELLALGRCTRPAEWRDALRTLAMGTAPAIVDAIRRRRR